MSLLGFLKKKAPAPTGYPAGYAPDPRRPDVFDAAVRHYPRGFIKGPPADAAEARALREAQAQVLHRSLHALATAPVRDAVVLRGGLTLEAWFPERARHPHDVDLVVRDAALAPDTPPAMALLGGIQRAVCGVLRADGVEVSDEEIRLDSIWTYERAEGRRLSVPWVSPGSARDVLQIDVVFREPLQDPPALERLRDAPAAAGPSTYRDAPAGPSLWFASRAESLAWKILWLDGDFSPRAKDLYDAVLLAEHVPLPVDLVRRVFAGKGDAWKYEADSRFVLAWEVEWESFAIEYPELAVGDSAIWLARSASSLKLVP